MNQNNLLLLAGGGLAAWYFLVHKKKPEPKPVVEPDAWDAYPLPEPDPIPRPSRTDAIGGFAAAPTSHQRAGTCPQPGEPGYQDVIKAINRFAQEENPGATNQELSNTGYRVALRALIQVCPWIQWPKTPPQLYAALNNWPPDMVNYFNTIHDHAKQALWAKVSGGST